MRGTTSMLAAVFDGDQGTFFFIVLIALLIAGTVMLVVNLGQRNRPPPAVPAPPAPKWEAVPDEEPEAPAAAKATPARRQPAAPRRRA